MKEQWEECVVDLETLLKIDPGNAPARKELLAVVKAREDEVRPPHFFLYRFFMSIPAKFVRFKSDYMYEYENLLR